MPTPQSNRYICSVKLQGKQPADLHVFATKKGGFCIRINWQSINPPSPETKRETFGPYTDLYKGLNAALTWFYAKFKDSGLHG